MKRFLIAATAAMLLAGAGVAWSAAGGDGPRQDRLAGGGVFGPGCSDGSVPFCPVRSREFSIDAASNPEGGGAYGTFMYGTPELGATAAIGRVTCLTVEGDSAVAGGYITGGTAFPAFKFFVIYMKDLGPAASSTRDRSSAAFAESEVAGLPAGFPNECPPLDNNAFDSGYLDLRAGDVQVTEAK